VTLNSDGKNTGDKRKNPAGGGGGKAMLGPRVFQNKKSTLGKKQRDRDEGKKWRKLWLDVRGAPVKQTHHRNEGGIQNKEGLRWGGGLWDTKTCVWETGRHHTGQ